MLLTLKTKFICSTVLHTLFVLFASQLTAALPFSMTTSSTTHMLCYITHMLCMLCNMLYILCYITNDMLCYITYDKLCYITHEMLCYITHHMLCYVI